MLTGPVNCLLSFCAWRLKLCWISAVGGLNYRPCALWFTEADMWVSMCVCLKTAALPEPCIIMSAVALTKRSPFLSFYLCVLSVIPLSHATTLNIYADMNTLSLCLTSGSRFLKTYILVFSIMENRSGLSLAHFISQTSLRSNLDGSPGVDPPSASPDEARVSTSKNVNTPVISIIASRLIKYICFKTNSHSTSRKRDWLI